VVSDKVDVKTLADQRYELLVEGQAFFAGQLTTLRKVKN